MTEYQNRPAGSQSKLNTFRDGLKILMKIIALVKKYKPLEFFSFLSIVTFFLAFLMGLPILKEYQETGFVPKIPSVIFITSLGVIGNIFLIAGIILSAISKHVSELKRIAYLNL